MATKRGRIDLDPDYDDVTEHQAKRQRVLEQDAKAAAKGKIENVIREEFAEEIHGKEMEINIIDQRIYQSRMMLDRLRACIVANFYASAGQGLSKNYQVPSSNSQQVPSVHPAVKEHLGKAPKNIPATVTKPTEASQENKIQSNCHSNQLAQQIKKEKEVSMETDQPSKDSEAEIDTTSRGSRFKVKKKIIIGNVSKYIPVDRREENDQSTHKWMIYVRGPKEAPRIDGFVKKVWFLLHPSYRPNDLVEVSQPPFHLTRRGWGEFPVRVQLHFKDPRNKRLDVIHLLKLDKTYTGLQTIGAETVVEVELEKEIEKTKAAHVSKYTGNASKQNTANTEQRLAGQGSLTQGVELLENNVTIKEHVSPQKPVTPVKSERKSCQRELTQLDAKSIPSTSGIPLSNKENCYNTSGMSTESSADVRTLKTMQDGSSPSFLSTVLLTPATDSSLQNFKAENSNGGEITQAKVNFNNVQGSVKPTLTTSSAAGGLPKTNSPLLIAGSSGVQLVLGGFASLSSTGLGKQKEDKNLKVQGPQSTPQTGKSLLKKMYNTKGKSKSPVGNAASAASSSAGQTVTKPTSSVVLQGLGSLSGTGMIGGNLKDSLVLGSGGQISLTKSGAGVFPVSSSNPTVNIVTSNKQESQNKPVPSPSKGVTPTPNNAGETTSPQTLYVRCKDNQGNIFLVPHQLLKQVVSASTQSQKTESSVSAGVNITSTQKMNSLVTSPKKPTVSQVTSPVQKSSITSNVQKSSITSPVQNSSNTSHVQKTLSSGQSTPMVMKTSPLKMESSKNSVNILNTNAAQKLNTSSQPSLFIKIEPQASKAGVGENKNMTSLSASISGNTSKTPVKTTGGSLTRNPVTQQVKSNATTTLLINSMDHVYTIKSDVATSSKNSVAETTQKFTSQTFNSSNTSNSLNKSDSSHTEKTVKPSTSLPSQVSVSGQLKVTPQGLKVVNTKVNSDEKLKAASKPSSYQAESDNDMKTTLGASLVHTPSGTTVIFPSGDNKSGFIKKISDSKTGEINNSKVILGSLLKNETAPHLQKQNTTPHIQKQSTAPHIQKQSATPHIQKQSTSLLNMNVQTMSKANTTKALTSGPTSLIGSRSSGNNDQSQETQLGSRTISAQNMNKVMTASLGNKKLVISVPNKLESSNGTMETGNPTKQQNKYLINDEDFQQEPQWKEKERKIINLKKKKCYLTAPVKVKEIKPICAEDFPDVLSLVRAAVKRHPIVSPTADPSQHPYCAKTCEQWLNWNIGRRRASEWQRASSCRKFIKKHLHNEEVFKGQSLWTTKQIMAWCRLHAYSPHYMETTLHPTPVELSADSTMVGKIYSSVTDSEEMLPQLQKLTASSSFTWDSDDDIDIISVEPAKVQIKKEIKTEPILVLDPVIMPPSDEALFIQDITQKVGVKFEPCEIDGDIHGSVSEDMIYTVMKTFIGDLLKESFANKVNMGRYADGIGVGDIYRTLKKCPLADFITNAHLGVKEPDITKR